MEIPQTLTLYKPHRHNYCVVQYNFTFKKIVQDDNGDCPIYIAPCPYKEEKYVSTSLASSKYEYFTTPREAALKCLEYQKEKVEMAEDELAREKKTLQELEENCDVREDVSRDY